MRVFVIIINYGGNSSEKLEWVCRQIFGARQMAASGKKPKRRGKWAGCLKKIEPTHSSEYAYGVISIALHVHMCLKESRNEFERISNGTFIALWMGNNTTIATRTIYGARSHTQHIAIGLLSFIAFNMPLQRMAIRRALRHKWAACSDNGVGDPVTIAKQICICYMAIVLHKLNAISRVAVHCILELRKSWQKFGANFDLCSTCMGTV